MQPINNIFSLENDYASSFCWLAWRIGKRALISFQFHNIYFTLYTNMSIKFNYQKNINVLISRHINIWPI